MAELYDCQSAPSRQGYSLLAWKKWRNATMTIFCFRAKTYMRPGGMEHPNSLGAEVFLALPASCVAMAIWPWLYHDTMSDWLFIVCISLPISAIPRKTQDLILPSLQCYILLQDECHSFFFLIKQTLREARIWNLSFISCFLSLTGFPNYWW